MERDCQALDQSLRMVSVWLYSLPETGGGLLDGPASSTRATLPASSAAWGRGSGLADRLLFQLAEWRYIRHLHIVDTTEFSPGMGLTSWRQTNLLSASRKIRHAARACCTCRRVSADLISNFFPPVFRKLAVESEFCEGGGGRGGGALLTRLREEESSPRRLGGGVGGRIAYL